MYRMNEILSYIIRFLLSNELSEQTQEIIGYTSIESEFSQYKLVIFPSDFFNQDTYGTKKSLPQLPLSNYEDVPILFGEPKIEKKGETLVLYADIIASTYFLISRYEEIIRRDIRDEHGRFPGKESLPFKAGFITRPIVEEYGKLLRNLLRKQGVNIPEPKSEIRKIYLTHDVDVIAHYRHLRSICGALLKNRSQLKIALKSYFKGIEYDPWFTFSWLLEQDKAIDRKKTESIFFIKLAGGKHWEDQPWPNIETKDYQFLFQLLKRNNATIGLHASYEAGIRPELILSEKEKLEKTTQVKINYNRHHFLDTREPEDMEALIEAGITDDFSLTYADIAGFRLGTCRAVRWINPVTQQLTSLTLHPLTIMDGTLSEKEYMYLPENAAYDYAVDLIDETEKHGGDLCLLWHNAAVEKNGNFYHRSLYADLIDYLKKK